MQMADWSRPAACLLLDHDSKFTAEFDAVFEAEGTEVKRVGPIAPNLNGFAKRWVQTARNECLDHFLICGENHLRHITKDFIVNYNDDEPRQSLGNGTLPDATESESPRILPISTSEIYCRERLGGLLRHSYRQAA